MGMDQQLLFQKDGTIKTIEENGKELGYWRNKHWLNHIIKTVTTSDKNIIRILPEDIPKIRNKIFDCFFSDLSIDIYDYIDNEEILTNMTPDDKTLWLIHNVLPRFTGPFDKALGTIKCGYQVYYLYDE